MPRALATVLMGMPMLLSAQTPVTWHITFEPGADRTLDSLQGCWQVGAPDKPVFDSAFSAPNALVTDTVLPYPVGGISYAEFSVPMNFWAESGELTFQHAMDVDSGEAYGWLEYFDAYDAQAWVNVDPWGGWPLNFNWTGAGTDTDTALVFTGSSNGWVSTTLEWYCTLVVLMDPAERMTFADSLRFRFAFQALANTNARDGWMIDDLMLTNIGCPGSIAEKGLGSLTAYPNPATDRLVLERTGNGAIQLDLYRADGALVRRDRMIGERHVLDLGDLPEGPYLLRADGGGTQATRRVVVLH